MPETTHAATDRLPDIPRRQDLLRQIARANGVAMLTLPLQLIAIAVLAYFIRWPDVLNSPWVSLVAIAVMVGPIVMSILNSFAQKRKRIEDLKETTRFGQFDKHLLKRLYRETLTKLGLPDDHLPVYITGDRSMNAMAAHYGLGSLFKSLNGIYLHRQLLHKLTPAEVQDTIGHELGHYYKHYIVSTRYMAVTLALGSLIGLTVAQVIGMDSIFGYLALLAGPAVFWMLAQALATRQATIIEYLCDDLGAHTNGVIVSINALLKQGAESELHQAVLQYAMSTKNADQLDAAEVVEAVLTSIPYGNASPDQVLDAVETAIRKKVNNRRPTLVGFIDFAWNSTGKADQEKALQSTLESMRLLQQLPRLAWEETLPHPPEISFDEATAAKLIALIESQPDHHLFRLPEEIIPGFAVHPPMRSRVLYLWYNRQEIEAEANKRLSAKS